MAPPFAELIDLAVVRPLMKAFSKSSGVPMAIIDRSGKVLITSGWQKVCTSFHRREPFSAERCIESDTDFSRLVRSRHATSRREIFESECRNGLAHIGFPILIEGEHTATLFLSQFFYTPPDLERFRQQARQWGLDEEAYLEAVRQVPVLDRDRIEELLGFYLGFVDLLGSLGTEHLRRLESRRQLEESERKFRSIFEGALDSIVLVAPDGRLLEANEQTLINLGYLREELLELTKFDIHAPQERTRMEEFLQAALQEGSATMESMQQRRDGSLFPVEISARRVELEGQPAILCLSRDISGRKEAEKSLKQALLEAQEAREKIDAILKSVPDGLVVTDRADRVVLVNEAAMRLLSTSSDAALPVPMDCLLPEEGLREQIRSSLRSGQEQGPLEWEATGEDGTRRGTLQARSMPVRTAEGRLGGTITLLRDVTREREVDRMKDDFISTAAHELRTPLATIMGFVELLLRQEAPVFTPEEQREFLQTVYDKSVDLSRIIGDLLDLSRIRSGHLITLQRYPEDLVPLITRIVRSYEEISRSHTFELDLPDSIYLMIDGGKIVQVLENLLSNAVKFSPSGGRIAVSGRCMEGHFQVTVADEGIGMNKEELERVFEKFYRADASTTAAGGLGLGMSIVKNIIEAHGGQIWVESAPGRGTQAHFTLPLDESPCPEG